MIEVIKNIVVMPEIPKMIEDTIYEKCKIKEQNFFNAIINNCTFIDCTMEMNSFSKAKITNCKFINCYMQFSNFVKASIYNCEFISCDFHHSNFCYSSIHETLFKECILRCLFKDLDWKDNSYDKETIIVSCGGTQCKMNQKIIEELIEISKRSVDRRIVNDI